MSGVIVAVGLTGFSALEAAPVAAATTTVSVFGARTPVRVDTNDSAAVELGMRFRPTKDGVVTGVRFYKSAKNTGVHTGTLWSNSGAKLATVTFTGETASGWQTASLSTPVSVKSGTSYVVSYHTNTGHYAADAYFFSKPTTAGPLTALADGAAGANSVYTYGASAFPTKSWRSANYWVDVTFQPTVLPVALPA
ncbi:MAG TPA: DUF4082 domain-containing protein, partial [Actinomycetales bacterium]